MSGTSAQPQAVLAAASASGDIHTIKHVVVIMQENRSFDEYFGTYPGADGIPRDNNGVPTVCNPDPANGTCQKPYHDTADVNHGGPHGSGNVITDVDNGNMDGFISAAEAAGYQRPDVMGYHTAAEIPNYWSYAQNYVLQDHMFESVPSWSLPSHLDLVSAWAAVCSDPSKANSCKTSLGEDQDGDMGMINGPTASNIVSDGDDDEPPANPPDYAWTDLTYLLNKYGVTWRYYRGSTTPEIWNPLPDFATVHQDDQLGNIESTDQLYADAAAGALPAVSWVVPNFGVSDHPTAAVSGGQAYVTELVNALMRSPDWTSTAIFVSWDDWGGFYDHVQPPELGGQSLGLRVPGLMISPYARHGYIDHQTLDFDAYLKFIEDDFMNGQRLDPATDGRPDSRPDVREADPGLGNLLKEFNFAQVPQAGLQLNPSPAGGKALPLAVDTATVEPAVQATGSAPFTVSFNGSASTDHNGRLASWTLAFGDGTPAASGAGAPPANVRHAYARPGTFTARLTIVDVSGPTSTATQTVVVRPATPQASLTVYRQTGIKPLTVTFNGSLSSDPDGRVATWKLDFGDKTSTSGTGRPPAKLSHTYAAAGTFKPSLIVRDPYGHASAASTVTILVGSPMAPSVTTGAASVDKSQLQLAGTLNTHLDRSSFWFQYGPTTAYGSSTRTGWSGYEPVTSSVFQVLPAPTAPGTYHYRLVARNSSGTSYGPDRTFTIGSASASFVSTGPATASGTYSVAISGTVTPNGLPTTYKFQYGETTTYGHTTTSTSAGSGASPVTVRAVIQGLTPEMTYHYRLVATSSAGTVTGADATLLIGRTVVSTGTVGSVTPTTAVVGGAVNPSLEVTTFHVEYGTSVAYGLRTTEAPAAKGASILNVTSQLAGLRPATTYHFRLVATNPLGQSAGADATFRTASRPVATTGTPGGVDGTLLLNGLVSPNGLATTYWFEYGRSTPLGQATARQAAGAGVAGIRVSTTINLSGLAAGTTYHYRLVAGNSLGIAVGEDRTVTVANSSSRDSAAVVCFGLFTVLPKRPRLVPIKDERGRPRRSCS